MKKYKITLLLLIWGAGELYAQDQPDIMPEENYSHRDLYTPPTFNLSTEIGNNYDYKLKEDGQEIEKGRIKSVHSMKFDAALPILNIQNFSVYGNAQVDLHRLAPATHGVNKSLLEHKNDYNLYFKIALSGNYIARIGNRFLFLNATIAGDGWNEAMENVHGTFAAMISVKSSDRSNFAVGLYGMTRTNWIPVLPIIIYNRRITENMNLDIVFPNYVYLRYQFHDKQRLSVGATLQCQQYYLKTDRETLPQISLFSESTIKPEIVYEYMINDHFYLTARAGCSAIVQAGFFDKKHRGDGFEPLVSLSRKFNGYLQIGFSINLF